MLAKQPVETESDLPQYCANQPSRAAPLRLQHLEQAQNTPLTATARLAPNQKAQANPADVLQTEKEENPIEPTAREVESPSKLPPRNMRTLRYQTAKNTHSSEEFLRHAQGGPRRGVPGKESLSSTA